jgi:diadenylate cyclase
LVSRLAQLYESVDASDLVQILILALVIFAVLRFLSRTCGSGSSLGRGLGIVVVGLFLIVQVIVASLDLTELSTVFDYLLTTVLIGMLIIFQPELRRGLMVLGRSALGRYITGSGRTLADQLADAAAAMSRDRVGALIAVQREVSLAPFIETGERIDAEVSVALLRTIFTPRSPLHDGAVVISNGRLTAAACQLPLGLHEGSLEKSGVFLMGMRHRAALALSVQTDAAVVVVSEETGRLSLAVGGRFEVLTRETLASRLAPLLYGPADKVLHKAA